MSPTVSVVIPVHNGMPHLPETIAGVMAQSRAADEVIVLENQSTDGSSEWLETEAPAGVTVVRQPELVGPGRNWTDAIALATGDYVKLLCADDLLFPRALEIQVDLLEKHPRAVMTASQRQVLDHAGRIVVRRRGLMWLRGETDGRAAIRRSVLAGGNLMGETSAVLFRREALQSCMPWDDSLGYVIDLDMYAKVLQLGTLVVHREPLTGFRLANGSWSTALHDVQARHVNSWVERTVAHGRVSIGLSGLAVSRANVASQTTARRAAYAWTSMRYSRSSRRAQEEPRHASPTD